MENEELGGGSRHISTVFGPKTQCAQGGAREKGRTIEKTSQFARGVVVALGAVVLAACGADDGSDESPASHVGVLAPYSHHGPRGSDEALGVTTAALNAVSTGGTAYADQCQTNQVPLPVPWGTATLGTGHNKWNQMGGYEDGYTNPGSVFATLYIMESDNMVEPDAPPGICASITNNDGLFSVICQGANGKACFWEANQHYWPTIGLEPWPTQPTSQAVVIAGSTFPAAPDPSVLPCTVCHAGENAFITHLNLDHPTNQALVPYWMPTNGNSKLDPIVPSWWYQNTGTTQASDYPASCLGCHTTPSSSQTSRGGRFPPLRTSALSDSGGAASWCTILKAVVNRPGGEGGMPPSSFCTPDVDCPMQTNPAVQTMLANCGTGVPPAPTNLVAGAGNAQITLTWTPVSGQPEYNVYRATTAGGQGTTPVATDLLEPTWTNTGLTNGTTYYYKVAAVNGTAVSTMSNEASAKPFSLMQVNAGGVASGSWIADTGTGGFLRSWTNTVDTSLLSGTIPPQAVLKDARIGNLTYNFTGLVASSSHTFTLYFVENFFTASGKRVFTVRANGTAKLTNLDIYAATGARYKALQRTFTANADSTGKITLTFVPSVDNASIAGIILQ